MMSGPDQIVDELLSLRRNFIGRLPDRIRLLGRLLDQAEADPGNWTLSGELLNEVHKLHGSASGYRLTEIAAAAAEWEHFLRNLPPDLSAGERMARSRKYCERLEQLLGAMH